MIFRKHLTSVGMIIALLAILATIASANILTGGSATADCTRFALTVNAIDLSPGTAYVINFAFTLTCGGVQTIVPGRINFTASGTTATQTATGTWLSSWSQSANCTVTGSATLTSSGSMVPHSINA